RDLTVTGVQTCALPISAIATPQKEDLPGGIEDHGKWRVNHSHYFRSVEGPHLRRPIQRHQHGWRARENDFWRLVAHFTRVRRLRSEERRVGKELRSRLW